MRVALRCDGDDRVGAGHVARSLQIAAAFLRAGHEAELVGRYEGLAADLVAGAGVGTRPAGTIGTGSDADAVVVDSYEVPAEEVAELAAAVPTLVLWDHGPPPPASVLVHYHGSVPPQDAEGAEVLLGPAYAPIAPRFVAARRPRGLRRALVSVGGSETGLALADAATRALRALGDVEVVVAGPQGRREVGLFERVAEADVSVTAAGATAYELACAGVPAVAIAIAANQRPVVRGLTEAGAVLGLDVPADQLEAGLAEQVAHLAHEDARGRLAAQGPAVVDGAGANRIRDALAARVEGRAAPTVLRFRPAQADDAAQLYEWRSDPAVRAASRSTGEVAMGDHTAWLGRVLADPARTLWLIDHGGRAVGNVRFDREGDRAEISTSLGADHRGAGLGTRAIRESTHLYLAAHPGVGVVEAHVRPSNAGSLVAFERAGYVRAPDRDGLAVLEARQSAPAA